MIGMVPRVLFAGHVFLTCFVSVAVGGFFGSSHSNQPSSATNGGSNQQNLNAAGWTVQPTRDSNGGIRTTNDDLRGGNQNNGLPYPRDNNQQFDNSRGSNQPINPRGNGQPTFGTRDLIIEVIGGTVPKKDTFSTDAYMSVSVCKQKERTPTAKSTLKPVWNWKHQFTNVKPDCRIKFHLYDDDFGSDDTIGEFETTVQQYLSDRNEESTLIFGKHGEGKIKVRVKYV